MQKQVAFCFSSSYTISVSDTAFQVRLNPMYLRKKPIRSEKYKAYIRRYACCACGSTKRVEAAHTGGHGLGQKSSDLDVIPLCLGCHQTDDDSLHKVGPVQFAAHRELDVPKLIEGYQEAFIKFQIKREGIR